MPGLRQSAFWMVLTALLSLFGTTAFGAFTCVNPLNAWYNAVVVVDYGAKTCRISRFNQPPPTAPQNGVRFYTTGNLNDPNDAGTRFISYQQSVNGIITITGITLTSPQSTPISEGTTGINNYLNSTTKDFVGSRVIGNIYTISSNFGNFEFGVGDYDVSPSSITIDNGTPIVTNVTSSTADGTYRAGDQININVSFDRPVFVTGTPQLTLSVGSNRIGYYSTGNGTSTLTFNYTVQSGDTSSDLEYSNTSALAVGQGGAIKDSVDTDANLALPAIGEPGSLSANKNLVIDAALPLVTGLSPTSGLGGGGTSVLISGSGFSGATAVKFGATNAASFTINSATSITVAAPPHASGTVNVTVTTPNGTSAAGAANQYTYYTTPDAPVIGTATAGDTQASVSFTAPVNNGGSPIISYTVTSSPGNFTGIGSASPLIITGLSNGTAYTFTVTATNGAGTGPASTVTNSVTPKASQTITFADPGAQNFGTTPTLTATATSNSPVTFSSSTTGVCTVNGRLLTFVSTGNCTINADQAGNSTYSAAPTVSRTFSVNAVVPNAPTIGIATAGDTQATVAFTAPTSTGGSAITGYTVTSNPNGFTGTGSASPIIVTGLANGQAYTFTVTATNIAGTSPASAASNAVTPTATQTITFADPGTQAFGTSPTLTATATSSATVTFTSSTTGVCTITSGGALTFVTAGNCTINADQAGNASFAAAQTVSRTFSVSAVVPAAPTIGTATAGTGQASVTFSPPANTGGSPIIIYTVTSSPGNFTATGSTSPLTITGLTNGTAYTFTVTATNGAGTSPASAASNAVTPTATQTITFADPGTQAFGTSPTLTATATSSATVTFTSSTTGVCTITSGGALTFVTVGNCTINADQAGNASFAAAQTVSRTFSVSAVVPAAPTMGAATAGSGQASVTFSPPANTGGSAIIIYTVTSSPGNFTATGSTSPLTITGLTNGTAYTFTVAAMTIAGTGAASAASNAVTPALTSTPSTELATKSDDIRQTLTDAATTGLTSALSANQAMVQDAKGRFVAGDTPDMALNLDGSFEANPVSVSSMGTFFGQSTQGNGTRQLVFGSFDVQRDDTSGASTARFSGKVAWEREISNSTLLGYFIGGDLARSNIAGSFTGDQDHLGVTAGGYAVHEMAKQLYLDGFVSVGAGRNNLTMADSVLALESDYTTRSATFGMSVSGVIGPQGYEIWPELALTVGRTWIDTVAFTGTAYGTTDDSLSLDAGMVTLANLTFRPEFRVPLDGTEVSKSLRLITLAPRLICQKTTTTTTAQTCGGGAELGLQTHSADGTTTASAQILSDWIDGQTRTSGQLSVEMRF